METEWRDLDIDSLELVELVTALEDRFDVKIADGELKSISRRRRRGSPDPVARERAGAGVSVAVTGARRRDLARRRRRRVLRRARRRALGNRRRPPGRAASTPSATSIRASAGASTASRSSGSPPRSRRRLRRRLGECDPDRVAVAARHRRRRAITLQEQCESFLARGERGVSPNFVPMMMPNAAAGAGRDPPRPARPRLLVASACATGAHAIGEGMRMIERGAADVVLAGRHRGGDDQPLHRGLPPDGGALDRGRLAAVRRSPRRLRDGRGRGRARARARGARQPRAAPRSSRASSATAPPTTPSTWSRPTSTAAAR